MRATISKRVSNDCKNRYLTAGLESWGVQTELRSPQIPGGPNLRQAAGPKSRRFFFVLMINSAYEARTSAKGRRQDSVEAIR
jgi:hypothetical protein